MSWRESFGAAAKKKFLFILGGGLVLLGAAGLAYSLLSPNLRAVKPPTVAIEEMSASLDAPIIAEAPATPEAAPMAPMTEAQPAEAAAPAPTKDGVEKWNPPPKKRAKRASAKRARSAEPSGEQPTVARRGAYYGWARRRSGTAPMEAAPPSPPAAVIAEARDGESAPSVGSSLKLVDEAIRRLADANVAFNTPSKARLGKDLRIVAKLSTKLPQETLAREVEGLGTPTVAPLKVSDRVIATLTGGGAFDISPAGPQEQAVSESELTEWSWLVTPKAAGEQTLILTFDAIIAPQGKDVRRTVRTLTQKINVEVGWPESAGEWIEFIKKQAETAQWISATVLAIGGAVLAWAKKISPDQSDAERKAAKNEAANAPEGD